ncbi:TonB-dependent receptor plug domain-containing protein [Hydrotalea sp.]|uniref:TonB-dependent receptor family protein n=1 Tax=Hydrotalea sp. TaxID=2881279 RepID=UPI002605E94F|nr:TonB-dependent receptor plug domain-containing protein [Hydrotalea sp.]
MKKVFLLQWLLLPVIIFSQNLDTPKVHILKNVLVTGFKTVRGIGHMPDFKDGIIYAGKKSEVILVDSLDANKAINNTRQILGRIPGLNIVETETGGFTANGIATRGLNPIQSIEMNTRQNGYNISADIYGYNEAYYLPPMEAIQRIEMVRGAAALQFGAQFGGLVNYVTKEAPANKPFEFYTSQTAGSYGLFNTFNSIAGNFKKLSYYVFVQYRYMNGYRPNSKQWQVSGFGKLRYLFSEKLNITAEYSLLRNTIQMPGGLTDSLFLVNPKISTRSRNWLKTPWNIVNLSVNYHPSKNTSISIKSTYLFGNRSLVWRNEDGGPAAQDTINHLTNTYSPREVGIENMKNITTEIRFSYQYQIAHQKATFSGGIRHSSAWFKRLGGGEGTTNSNFDLSIQGDWGYDLNFTTLNIAPFIENIFPVGNRLSIIPGFRFEYLNTTANGYKTSANIKQSVSEYRSRIFPLFGMGITYKTGNNTNVYGNISQAYRPIEYSQLEPFGITSRIDPNLKDSYGFNADLGYRGTIKNYFNFDVNLFYLAYNDRIGVLVQTDPNTGMEYSVRKNIANSVHKGIESYLEFNIVKYLNTQSKTGLSIFNSFAFIDARYTNGAFKGNRVEAAVKTINRTGLIFNNRHFSATFQINNIGDAYGDASNVKISSDPVAGYIPAYTVADLSMTYSIKKITLKTGINNLTNQSYFTRRTDEYPGPGIIPAIGRSFYFGFSAQL